MPEGFPPVGTTTLREKLFKEMIMQSSVNVTLFTI
jgi:hypothetical protein